MKSTGTPTVSKMMQFLPKKSFQLLRIWKTLLKPFSLKMKAEF